MSDATGWEGARTRSSRIPVVLALAAVLAVGWLLGTGGDAREQGDQADGAGRGSLAIEGRPEATAGGADEARSEEGGPDGAPAGSAGELVGTGGRWQQLESAPVAAPRRHHAVYTGSELVVFGAAGEVAAYDAIHRLWWQREPVPRPDGGPAVLDEPSVGPVWTGSEVLVLTGPRSDAADAEMAAAAFDPQADAWRVLPAPPVTVVPPAVSVWTGEEWFVWGRAGGPRVREEGPPVGAAYEPLAGTWRRLPEAPIMLVDAVGGVATDRGVVVWGQRPGPALRTAGEGAFALRYAPAEDRWVPLPAPPLTDPALAVAAWTGSCVQPRVTAGGCGQVVLWGAPAAGRSPEDAPAAGARLDLAEGRWASLPSVPGFAGERDWARVSAAGAAWTDRGLLVVGGAGGAGLVFDRRGGWRELPERPPVLAPALAWTGAELLLWGGYGSGGSTPALRTWRPPLRPPPAGAAHPY
jgi:hypothetical protein